MSADGTALKRSPSPANTPVEKRLRTTSPVAPQNPDGKLKNTGPPRINKAEKKRRKKLVEIDPGSHDDVVWHEVTSILGEKFVEEAIESGNDFDSPFAFREEVEARVFQMSSTGEGLAMVTKNGESIPWVIVVPMSLPEEVVKARVYRHARLHSHADLITIVQSNPRMRNMNLVKCQYFTQCSGCQYQMIPYDTQLKLKRDVIVRAYKTFSKLPSISVPEVRYTAPSPLEYGYRTKITPHFDAPFSKSAQRNLDKRRKKKAGTSNGDDAGENLDDEDVAKALADLKIGFNALGKKQVMDIEECPIATPILNQTLPPLRGKIRENIRTYKKGVSLLLRDSLPIPSTDDIMDTEGGEGMEEHICVTDHRAMVRERVGSMFFEFPGGSFFQNNNSILVSLVEYVREAIFPSTPAMDLPNVLAPTHLVDAYCGSGFFSIMLSPYFTCVTGIEISADSIKSASHNARLNKIPEDKWSFRAGDASAIFDSVADNKGARFDPDKTAILIDPPRKGCDKNFIDQLVSFGASTVVYVSCNVHTQARDIGMILRESAERSGQGAATSPKGNGAEDVEDKSTGKTQRKYVLESIRGFDLFPQTAHVESVAVLRLV